MQRFTPALLASTALGVGLQHRRREECVSMTGFDAGHGPCENYVSCPDCFFTTCPACHFYCDSDVDLMTGVPASEACCECASAVDPLADEQSDEDEISTPPQKKKANAGKKKADAGADATEKKKVKKKWKGKPAGKKKKAGVDDTDADTKKKKKKKVLGKKIKKKTKKDADVTVDVNTEEDPAAAASAPRQFMQKIKTGEQVRILKGYNKIQAREVGTCIHTFVDGRVEIKFGAEKIAFAESEIPEWLEPWGPEIQGQEVDVEAVGTAHREKDTHVEGKGKDSSPDASKGTKDSGVLVHSGFPSDWEDSAEDWNLGSAHVPADGLPHDLKDSADWEDSADLKGSDLGSADVPADGLPHVKKPDWVGYGSNFLGEPFKSEPKPDPFNFLGDPVGGPQGFF